jgi:hypothetical protein
VWPCYARIGRYGAGQLSLLTNETGRFILLGCMTIARQSEESGEWLSMAPGWRVTAEGETGVRVQFKESEGVVVALP